MGTPTAHQNFETVLEFTPISEEDKQRIRDQTAQGLPLTPAQIDQIPGGAELAEAQRQDMAAADTSEIHVDDTAEVPLEPSDTADVNLPLPDPDTSEVETVGETQEVETVR